jgi:hypothetical protein
LGRKPKVCFYQKPAISRQAAFGEMQNAAERQKLGGRRTYRRGTVSATSAIIKSPPHDPIIQQAPDKSLTWAGGKFVQSAEMFFARYDEHPLIGRSLERRSE